MSEIRQIIGEEIRSKGVISFARFMDLALYCPVYGFYEREADTVGKDGHFFTSVSVGPLFGELLAYGFADLFQDANADGIALCEAGAHDGQLANDILNWMRLHRPGLYEGLTYFLVEGSQRRADWQARTLKEHAQKVRWIRELEDIQSEGPKIFFSNEFLDALPLHRLQWRADLAKWIEWGVTLSDHGELAWQQMDRISLEILSMLPEESLSAALPDCYLTEFSPLAVEWWTKAASALSKGFLLTIDYGLTAEDRFAIERTRGTLRAYHAHHVHESVLAHPGDQDITAHVDFEALQRAGESAGLRTESMAPQGRYLTRIAGLALQTDWKWDTERIRQFQTLTHPEHLGATFKVLVQKRT